MKSLRVRLIMGISLAAVLPLAAAMFLMAGRAGDAVHAQAQARLAGVMNLIESQSSTRLGRTREQLAIIAADPQLENLHRLQPAGGQGLLAYLEEKRELLGLHELSLASESALPGVSFSTDTSGRVLVQVVGHPVNASANLTLRAERLLDAAFLERLKQTSGVDLVLRDAAGATWATTLDAEKAPFVPLMENPEAAGLSQPSHLVRTFHLVDSLEVSPVVVGLVSMAEVNGIVAMLRMTALGLGLVGLMLAVLLGVIWSRQVTGPVETIAAFSQQISRGEWDAPLQIDTVEEFGTLVNALDRMREELRSYRERLLAGERQAAWGQMARSVAHEMRNPLTPIAVSVADLKRTYELEREDFPAILDEAVKTIDQEVRALNHLLREFSEFGQLPAPVLARVDAADVLRDLESLYARDRAEGRLSFSIPRRVVDLDADRAQLHQVFVNLVKNGFEAAGPAGRVHVDLKVEEGRAVFCVADSGPGLSDEQRECMFSPDFTTKRDGSGLGLTIVERIVTDHAGTIEVAKTSGTGTSIRISIPLAAKG